MGNVKDERCGESLWSETKMEMAATRSALNLISFGHEADCIYHELPISEAAQVICSVRNIPRPFSSSLLEHGSLQFFDQRFDDVMGLLYSKAIVVKGTSGFGE